MSDDSISPILVAIARVETKLDFVLADVASLKERVTALERAQDNTNGKWSGVNLAWKFAKQLPMGVLAFLLGNGNIKVN